MLLRRDDVEADAVAIADGPLRRSHTQLMTDWTQVYTIQRCSVDTWVWLVPTCLSHCLALAQAKATLRAPNKNLDAHTMGRAVQMQCAPRLTWGDMQQLAPITARVGQ